MNGFLDVGNTYASSILTVTNGLVLNGTALVGNPTNSDYGHISFAGSQTLSGNATVVFGNNPSLYNTLRVANDGTTLTIGPGVTVRGQNGTIGYNPPWGGSANVTVINQGTISADVSGGIITINAQPLVNQGLVQSPAGTLRPGLWDNTGQTMVVGTNGGSLNLNGGTIRGGSITVSTGASLLVNGSLTLDGVTVNGVLDVGNTYNGSVLTVTNGLVLHGTALVGNPIDMSYGYISFAGSQTLSGNGTVVFGNNASLFNTLRVANGGTTLTIGPDVTVHGNNGVIGYNGSLGGSANVTVINQGTISADVSGGTITITGLNFQNQGTLEAIAGGVLNVQAQGSSSIGGIEAFVGGTIDFNGLVTFNGAIGPTIQQGGILNLAGSLLGNTHNAAHYTPDGITTFDGPGNAVSPQFLEVMGQDLGSVPAGYTHNFVYGTLSLANNTYLRLVDQSDNSPGTNAEALYVNSLIVPDGCTLDLNGLHLYARAAQLGGTVLSGSVTQVPDSGPITLGTATPGTISITGELDEWTFFGRASENIAVVVDPGSGSVVTPRLNWVQALLVDANGVVLATNVNTSAGQALVLPDIILPADGIYRVQVRAHPSYSASTGNYLLTVWDVTLDTGDLVLNQQVVGRIETPYSMDRWNFAAPAGTQVQFDLVDVSQPGIQFKLTGPSGWIGFSNLTSDSGLVNFPTSGNYTLSAYGTGGQYGGDYACRLVETVQSDLTLGTPFTGQFVGTGQAQIFRINVPASNPMQLLFNNAGANNHVEVYLRFGLPPTRGEFDYSSTSPAGPNQQITVPSAYSGNWYALVYGDSISTPGGFTVQATTSGMFLTSVTPDRHGNSADAILTLTGAGFDPTSIVSLVSSNGVAYANNVVSVDSFTQITASIPSNSVPPGLYTVRVSQPDGDVSSLTNAFTLQPGAEAKLETRVIVPAQVGYHALATIWVEYQNSGNAAMPSPLLELGATQNGQPGAWLTLTDHRLVQGFWTSATPEGFAHSVQFLASGAIPGLLQPGESGRVPVYYAGWQEPWDRSYPPIYFNLGVLTADNTNFVDWAALKDNMRPSSLTAEQWEPVFWNLVQQTGLTWGDYVKMLNDNARYLYRLGESVTDIHDLLGFEVMQASGLSVSRTLASAADAQVQSPGLPLTFTRSFSTDIPSHFSLGRLGRGWSDNWDRSLTNAPDGTVTIFGPGGSRRVFQPDSRYAGRYFAPAGDSGTLTPAGGGAFTLRESEGTTYAFLVDGKLNYVADTHGNSVACIYSEAVLTRLTHSAGPHLDLAYIGSRLASVTDSLGRQTVFTYDGSGEHLQTATDYRSQTSTYSYDLSGLTSAATRHALTNIFNTDGTESHYAYDTFGRLIKKAGCCGSPECTTFICDSAGCITATDALTNSTKYYFDHRGLLVRTENPLGGIVHRTFDTDGRLLKVTDAAGRSRTFTYDSAGNLSSETETLGYSTRYTYTADFNRLASVLDAKGNLTRYAHEPNGNVSSATYPDGSHEDWTYDSRGKLISWTNRRRQTIYYTNDVLGRVIARAYPDGVVHRFNYDAQGNLTDYTDPLGTTTQEFDADGRLSKITYPGNRWLGYTYDVAGRRASMTNELGYRTAYHYDVRGRLERLTDERGSNIVVYAYDPAGRMALKTLGNGVYTTYTYDPVGQLLDLFNHKPDGSVLSRFQYTYDSRGRRDTMTTTYGTGDPRISLAGLWRYDYDDTGQLIGWTAPWGRRVDYTYDALGNRLNVRDSGTNTAYTVNNLNQYTHVGSTTYQYDPDGNLTNKVAGAGMATYTWSYDNRLLGLTTDGVVWQNFFDADGNRARASSNGVVTDFVFDSTGLGNVVGEYDHGSSSLIARYAHADGLLSRIGTPGSDVSFAFDAIGSTTELVNNSGMVPNAYVYSPYGEQLFAQGSVPNDFQFVGGSGVRAEVAGLCFVRARYFDPATGRFNAEDPIGLDGGSVNLYQYAKNTPTLAIDASGLHMQFDVGTCGHTHWEDGPYKCTYQINPACPAKGRSRTEAHEKKHAEQCNNNRGGENFNCLEVEAYAESEKYDPEYKRYKEYFEKKCNEKAPYDRKQAKCDLLGGSFCGNGGGGGSGSSGSTDPNELCGPSGYGTQNFVRTDSLLPYTIHFENETNATAPAQQVVVSERLTNRLDWTTFELTEIAFGDQFIAVPPHSKHFETSVQLSVGSYQFVVQIEAGIHLDTGEVYARFQSLNPTNGLPPPVDIGFLPPEPAHNPNDTPPVPGQGRGQGHISYTIRADTNKVSTGTEIRNVALISFDKQPAIATNQRDPHNPAAGTDPVKEALNTIDSGAPASLVKSLPAESSAAFQVCWSGQDDSGGSGIATYDVFVSTNGLAFAPWLQGTNGTCAYFVGDPGHSYGFYSVARDNVGNREPAHAGADAMTIVVTNSPPKVLVGPVGQTVAPGTNVIFSVTATGSAPLHYQWRRNQADLSNSGRIGGATSNMLTIASVQTNDAGGYTVVITNTAGSVASSPPAVLTVRQPTPPGFVPGTLISHTDGTFQFALTSDPGSRLEIQASTNLADWIVVTTLTNSTGTIPFTDAATNFSSRYYRARLLQ